MIPTLTQHISLLLNELKKVEIAHAGAGRGVHLRRALRMATDLTNERDRLFVKLNAQWHWLMEECPDDRAHEPDEVFLQREQTYLRTLESYVQVNDALAAAKAVL